MPGKVWCPTCSKTRYAAHTVEFEVDGVRHRTHAAWIAAHVSTNNGHLSGSERYPIAFRAWAEQCWAEQCKLTSRTE
jgi:hypothetical protein